MSDGALRWGSLLCGFGFVFGPPFDLGDHAAGILDSGVDVCDSDVAGVSFVEVLVEFADKVQRGVEAGLEVVERLVCVLGCGFVGGCGLVTGR